MKTIEEVEAMLRDRAQVYPGHPAVPFLRAVAEAFVEHAHACVLVERKACAAAADIISQKHEDCDYLGIQDTETGEVPCSRRDGCLCDVLRDHGQEISKVILSRK